MDKNPELAVEDWTLEFLCKRNGGLLQEEHHFAGVQNAPKEGHQGIRLWLRFEGENKLGISIHAEGKKQTVKPIDIKLDEGVWTWIVIVGTNK